MAISENRQLLSELKTETYKESQNHRMVELDGTAGGPISLLKQSPLEYSTETIPQTILSGGYT